MVGSTPGQYRGSRMTAHLARQYYVCAACGRVMALRDLVGEPRHVGGREDRIEVYCRAGVGHRVGEVKRND